MRALVPVNDGEVLKHYIEAGAEEFYIGFTDEAWFEKFGEYSDINRLSGYRKNANQNSFEQMLKIIEQTKKQNRQIYVTFNASTYTQEQIEYIGEYLNPLKDAGADGIIISGIELLEIAKEYQIPAVVSTIAGIYNEDIARFYYENGAKRIIVPRDLSVDEIEEITKAVPDAEYEVFMMRNGCIFSDGNCLGFHRQEKKGICAELCHAKREIRHEYGTFKELHDIELNDTLYHHFFHDDACGLCSIYRFVKMGITAGKIVGRTDDWQEICQDIRSIIENVEIARECSSNEEYLEKMVLPNGERFICKLGLNCYYPEIRFS